MCLPVDLEYTESVRKELRAQGDSCPVHQVLSIRESDNELTSFCDSCQTDLVWRPGWHEAAGELPEVIEDRTLVDAGGFLVHLGRGYGSWCGHVEFLARSKDFVAAGLRPLRLAVFRRLFLSWDTYLEVYREAGVVPPTHRTDSGRRILTGFERDAVSSWVEQNVQTGAFRRGLVDLTPRSGGVTTEAADPVVWVRTNVSMATKRRWWRPLRSVPVDRVISTSKGGPLDAA